MTGSGGLSLHGGLRVCAAAMLLALALSALCAGGARAATFEVGCGALQTEMNTLGAEPAHGEGDTIVLNGVCKTASFELPENANFSLEGKPGTTAGFNGSAVATASLAKEVGTMTFANLLFENETGGAALRVQGARLTLRGDTFLENQNETGLESYTAGAALIGGRYGECESSAGGPDVTIVGSTFRGNTLKLKKTFGGGAALFLVQVCTNSSLLLEGNTFEENVFEATEPPAGEALGGAVRVTAEVTGPPTPLIQRGNVFDSNQLVLESGTANVGGGGEWVEGLDLTSVSDRYSRNFISGVASPHWSWGGGLGILDTTPCAEGHPTENTLQNAVVVGNSIGEGTGAGGAGIYVGCGPSTTVPNHLVLADSTVSENSVVTGGVAGIGGNPEDHLLVENSIIAEDKGGPELGGFAGPGGALSVTYSDVCAKASTSPFAGAGNICADPKLADDGNPASVDVHETNSSPTIDVGSNALLSAGLTDDFFGDPRLQSARTFLPACTPGATLGYELEPAVVDMGASEFGPVAIPEDALLCKATLEAPSVSIGPAGVLTLTFKVPVSGKLKVAATYKRTHTVKKLVHGHRRTVKKTQTISYGKASATGTGGKSLKIHLKPSKQALAFLKLKKRLTITLAISFEEPAFPAATQNKTVTVRYKAPHKRKA